MEDHADTLTEALQLYQTEHLTSRNVTPATRRAYSDDLTDLLHFLTDRTHLTAPTQVGLFHLERYMAALDKRGLSGASRRRRVAAVRSFFLFLQARGIVNVSPALRLIPPERERPEPRVLREE